MVGRLKEQINSKIILYEALSEMDIVNDSLSSVLHRP